MTRERDKVVSVVLSDEEWRAFVARHPHPVDWLRQQILSEIAGGPALPTPQPIVRQAPVAFSINRV